MNNLRLFSFMLLTTLWACTKPVKIFVIDTGTQKSTIQLFSDSTFKEEIKTTNEDLSYSGTWTGGFSEGDTFTTLATHIDFQYITLCPENRYVVQNNEAVCVYKGVK